MAYWVIRGSDGEVVLGDPLLTQGMKNRCDDFGPGSIIIDTNNGETVYTAQETE